MFFNILYVPVHPWRWFARSGGTWLWTVYMCDSLRNCMDHQENAFFVLLRHHTTHESDNKAFHFRNFKLIRSAAAEYYTSTSVVFHTWGNHVHLWIYSMTITLYIVLIYFIYILIYYLFNLHHYLWKCIYLMWFFRNFTFVVCSISTYRK